jgi:poly(hydroxyalkanoate) granule-associated protein
MAGKQTNGTDFTDAAHKVWLAGLGALATAGQEGEKLFKTLVTRGERLEKKLDPAVGKAGTGMRNTVAEVRDRAGRTIDSIQTTIDDSVSSTLHRLGVPTRKEIAELSKRVEKLTRVVEGSSPLKKKPARKTTKKKTAAKKTAAKKTAKRRAKPVAR